MEAYEREVAFNKKGGKVVEQFVSVDEPETGLRNIEQVFDNRESYKK